MESLRGLPEHIEADFGDSIVARDEALAVLGTVAPGLGPPDLCWLQKCPKKTGFWGGSGEPQGYYHYTLGRDVASSAAVAAYFALLNSKVERRSWMSSEFTIQRGFYCSYDPISRTDVRCELCVPGGVVVGCIDAAGQLHEATPQLWQQVQVCAFVRAMLYDPEMRLNGGTIIAYDPCPSAASEAGLLSSVLDLYSSGALPGPLQDIAEEQGFGVAAEHMDLVLAALWQHFRRRQRWAAAADFFRELMQVYSPAALLVAAAERARGLGSAHGAAAGASLLSELLARPTGGPSGQQQSLQPLVPATMVGLGHELLQQGESEAAASLARRALAASPRCRPAWLLLAKCFVAERNYAAALVALNVVPTPPLPAAEVELLHVVPPPAPKATTQPQVRLYDGELEAARACALEEASLAGSRLLAYLPGSILVNKEPLGAALQPDVCPNRITRSVLTAVYGLLQAIVADISWDKFLEVRSRVFLMQHEVVHSPHKSGEIQPQQDSPSQHQQQQQQQGLADLQAAQQAALLRKLEQLGLSAADSPPAQHSSSAVDTPSGSHQQPATSSSPTMRTASGGTPAAAGAASVSAAAAAGSGGGGAGGLPLLAVPGSLRPTPPASRGRLSSSGGGPPNHRAGGGDPQSYYANRLQEELNKPLATPGSRGSSSGGGAAPASAGRLQQQHQLSIRVPGDQQQHQQHQHQVGNTQPSPQQQQQQAVPSPRAAVASPGSSSAGSGVAPSAPRGPGTPGVGQQRSMAGRVLLLGKKAQPQRTSNGSGGGGGSRPPSARPVAPLGCGVPRSLAPNEVEDLSKYATASSVVSLRVPSHTAGVTPELWQTVFGGGAAAGGGNGGGGGSSSTAGTPAVDAGAGAAAGLRTHTRSSAGSGGGGDDDDDDGLSAAAAGLPRIRTRPLGEGVEGEQQCCWHTHMGNNTSWQQYAGQSTTARRYSSSMTSFLHNNCSCSSSSSDLVDLYSRGWSSQGCEVSTLSAGAAAAASSSTASCCGCSHPHHQEQQQHHLSQQQQQQPLGEGLDRTASLLTRTTSNVSTAGAGTTLPRTSSLRPGGSLGGPLHSSSGSGNLATVRSRRLSLAGEAANRSLEADREGLIKGWLHDDSSAQAGWGGVEGVGSPTTLAAGGGGVGGGSGRRLCVRFLDELIVALWHDLQAHMEWKVVDQTLRETRGGTAAELVLGMATDTIAGSPTSAASAASPSTATAVAAAAAGATVPGVSDGGSFEPPVLTCADWMRRGALAERLGHNLDARAAYRAAVKLHFSLVSYLALMRLEAAADSISNTALCASQILGWHHQRAGQPPATSDGSGVDGGAGDSSSTSSSAAASAGSAAAGGGLVLMNVPPADVSWALGMVADSASADHVRRRLADLPADGAHGMLAAVLDEWTRWQAVKVQPALAARKLRG